MGLDITAYGEGIVLLPPHEKTDDCWDNDHVVAFCYIGMEHSMRGLAGVDETWGNNFSGGRCYDVSAASSMRFRAGSYSGYNDFRRQLALVGMGVEPEVVWADAAHYSDKPFFEIVTFADNEGTIGPDAARDLHADFVAHRDAFEARVAGPYADYALERYDDWIEACEMAAEGGLISFH